MPFMNTLGQLSYNGYEFDGSSQVKVGVEFVKDEAGRTIIYQRQTYTVSATIADDPSTDQTLESIKSLLSEQGRAFVFTNRGFGNDVRVNVDGGAKDVKFGPQPTMLEWEPVGGNRAVEIVWEVVVCIQHCDGQIIDKGILAFNYDVNFSIDRGNATRAITGYLEIAQTRNGKRSTACAEALRGLLRPALPDGFERKHSCNISSNKSSMTFSVIDTQINSKFAFPQNCITASGTHDSLWAASTRRTTARNTISMELEMKPGVSQAQAWAIFASIVAKRIKAGDPKKRPVLIDELRASEDIWGRSSSFSCTYRILKTCGECFIEHSGLWQPIDTKWRLWKVSMADIFGERGHSGLSMGSTEAIVDLCGGDVGFAVGDSTYTPSEPAPVYPRQVFKNTKPSPGESYVDYKNAIVPYRERPVQRQAFLQSAESTSDLIGRDLVENAKFSFGKSGGTSDVIQEGGRGRYTVALVGSAIRAGYEIPRPSLESVGGQTTVEVTAKMMQEVIGNWLGVPVYRAAWAMVYAVGNAPGNVAIEGNPKEGMGGDGKPNCQC